MAKSRIARIVEGLEQFARRADAWVNPSTLVGDSSYDKAMLTAISWDAALDQYTLDNLVHQDALGRRICTIRATEMLRAGFGIEIQDESFPVEAAVVEEACRKWDVAGKAREASIWAAGFGGALVMPAANDGRAMDTPIDGGAIRTLLGFTIMDRYAARPVQYYGDPYANHYGEPELYELLPGDPKAHAGQTDPKGMGASQRLPGTRVHESRVIRFRGALTSSWRQIENDGWDLSILQALYDDLRDYNSTWRSVVHLVHDASQAVYQILGLLDMIASGKETAFRARMQAIELGRSVLRAIVIDKDESFHRESTQFAGLSDILKLNAERIAGDTGIPLTVLMGTSPAGLNATGASDIRLWYDTLAAARETELRPLLERMVWFIMSAQDGPTKGKVPERWHVTFPPLWQESPSEQAMTRKVIAETDAIWQAMGALPVQDVTRSRFEGGFRSEYVVDIEAAVSEAEAKRKRAEALAAKLAANPPQKVGVPPQFEAKPPTPTPPAEGDETGKGTPAAPGQTEEDDEDEETVR